MRTSVGMAVAHFRGRLEGRQPKLTRGQQAELARVHATGDYTTAELTGVFSVGRATVYRTLEHTHSWEAASAGRRDHR